MSIIHEALKKAGSAEGDRPPLSVSPPERVPPAGGSLFTKGSSILTGLFLGAMVLIVGWWIYTTVALRHRETGGSGPKMTASKASQTAPETTSPNVPERSSRPVEKDTARLTALREEALSAYQAGDMAGSQARFSELLALAPGDAVLHNNYGLVLRRLGRLPEAEVEYQKALALRPVYAEAMNNLAMVLEEAGRTDEAGVWYAKAITADPTYAVGHLNYGLFLERFGSKAEARSQYKQFLALASPDQSVLVTKIRDRLERFKSDER